jgi:hypothetical protein
MFMIHCDAPRSRASFESVGGLERHLRDARFVTAKDDWPQRSSDRADYREGCFTERVRPPPVQPLYFLQEDLSGSEYFQAYPSTDRDLGSIAMDHRALLHHSFTSSPGKEQSAIQQ